jgi:hypothetical protein
MSSFEQIKERNKYHLTTLEQCHADNTELIDKLTAARENIANATALMATHYCGGKSFVEVESVHNELEPEL